MNIETSSLFHAFFMFFQLPICNAKTDIHMYEEPHVRTGATEKYANRVKQNPGRAEQKVKLEQEQISRKHE